jgi:hypothetical protein
LSKGSRDCIYVNGEREEVKEGRGIERKKERTMIVMMCLLSELKKNITYSKSVDILE